MGRRCDRARQRVDGSSVVSQNLRAVCKATHAALPETIVACLLKGWVWAKALDRKRIYACLADDLKAIRYSC
ncbi:MAG: hypothetical protein KME42_23840 [Tildeniella nuda ZEHNDER 1965/U140]|nr:hypothetical protein [Tildeniella nuda ZEHNDER 1965/U140]